jgi:PleD family two-component response regulator
VCDEVITIVGRRMGRALRGKDCIGRFSSNKFGIVLQNCRLDGSIAPELTKPEAAVKPAG